MLFIPQQKKYLPAASGFTIIELIITMSVFALLSTVAIANFKNVDNSLVLRNVANQVALVIRKAQISGVSVMGIGTGASEVFPSYGAYFNTASPTTFILFADRNENKVYDASASPAELVQRYTLAQGYTIKSLIGNQKTASPGSSANPLSITFTRPNPEATIRGGATSYSDAEVVLQSKAGSTKTIVVWRSGQISIE